MSYKLTMEQANELFTRLGIEAAVVADNDADGAEPNYDELVEIVQPKQETPQVNEESIKSKAIGQQLGALRSLIAQTFSIKRSELDGLDQKDLIPKVKSLIEGRYTQTEAGLRQQLEEANNSLNDLEERLNNEWQKKLDAANAKYEERDVQDRFISVLNKIPRSGGDVMRQAQLAMKEAMSEYIVKYNPTTKQNEFYHRDNPEQRVMDGKNPLTDEAFSSKFIEGLGLKVSGTQHINPSEVKNNGGSVAQGGVKDIDTPNEKSAIEKLKGKVEATLSGEA